MAAKQVPQVEACKENVNIPERKRKKNGSRTALKQKKGYLGKQCTYTMMDKSMTSLPPLPVLLFLENKANERYGGTPVLKDGGSGQGLAVDGESGQGLAVDGESGQGLAMDGRSGQGLAVDGGSGQGLAVDRGSGQGLAVNGESGQGLAVDGGSGQGLAVDGGSGQGLAVDGGSGQGLALDGGSGQGLAAYGGSEQGLAEVINANEGPTNGSDEEKFFCGSDLLAEAQSKWSPTKGEYVSGHVHSSTEGYNRAAKKHNDQ